MSQNTTNLGNQRLRFNYFQEAMSQGFNEIFCDILPYGVYIGGELSRISANLIQINEMTVIIRSNEDDSVALHIDTTEVQDLIVGAAKPYIILRFGWANIANNFMDIKAVAWSEDPLETNPDKLWPLDIILGKVQFSGDIIDSNNPFDLTRKKTVFFREIENVYIQFRVSSSEVSPKKVHVSGGNVTTSRGNFVVSGGEYPSEGIPDTAAMSRTDLIVVDVNGQIKFIQGKASAINPAPAPKYGTYRVCAEIRRGPNRTDIKGSDIFQITELSRRGMLSADDFILTDAENYLPANAKDIESAFNFLFHNNLVLTPDDPNVQQKVLRRHIKFGTTDPDDIYAKSIPLKDKDKYFKAENVEDTFAEVAEKIEPIPSLTSFREWDSTYTYGGENPTIYHGDLFYANPMNVPAKGESPENYPDKWISASGGSGSGFSSRESRVLTAPADTVVLPPRLSKAMFWVVLVNQIPMEPDTEILWDYFVDGRNVNFHTIYPAGTRITFWYTRSNEYSVDFEDAWLHLRGSPVSVYFISAELKLKHTSVIIQFVEASLLMRLPFDVIKFDEVVFGLAETNTVVLHEISFGLHEDTDMISWNSASFSLIDKTDCIIFNTIEMGLVS